jgi:hypothetical protein
VGGQRCSLVGDSPTSTAAGAFLGAHQTAQQARGALPPQAFLSGYQLALVIAAAILIVGIPVSLRALCASGPARHYRQPDATPVH